MPAPWRVYLEFPAQLTRPPSAVLLRLLTEAYKSGRRHLHGDHIEPIEARPELALELDNIRTLCSVCHARKTGGPSHSSG